MNQCRVSNSLIASSVVFLCISPDFLFSVDDYFVYNWILSCQLGRVYQLNIGIEVLVETGVVKAGIVLY